MNEQDKQACKDAKLQNLVDLKPLTFDTGWQAALEYARGKQEPVGEVIDRERACLFEKQELAYGTLLYTAPPAQPVQDEIARLRAALKKANDQAEHFEREWYLRGDKIEALKAQPVQPAVAQEPVAWTDENFELLIVDPEIAGIEGAAVKLYTHQAPAVADFSDAYQGAREDLSIWKKRALEAEELNRKFIADINGQTFMGEPAPAVAVNEQLLEALKKLTACPAISEGDILNPEFGCEESAESVQYAEAAIRAAEAAKKSL